LQEKQRFLRQLLNAHERDRQLVAYEIHDTFVQDVIGALMFVDAFQAKKFTADDPDWEEFARARKLLRKAIDEARRMISGLRPPIIDEQGIVAAIEYLVSELTTRGQKIRFRHSMRAKRLPPLLEATIFRIVQEALKNLERHSGSDYGEIELTQEDRTIRLVVSDFGVGFDPENVAEGHFGMQSIQERTRLMGGTATIRSAPGEGADVIVELPFVEDD
jgi:signal transduction histidine kinase